MRRLYLQIYAAFLGVAALCVLVAAGAVHLLWSDGPEVPPPARGMASWVSQALPPPESPEFQPQLDAAASRLSLNLTLWDERGRRLGASGEALPDRFGACSEEGWVHTRHSAGMLLRLDDGRCLGATFAAAHRRHTRRLAGLLVFPLLFGVVAAGCYPVARRVTRRLEALQRGVERWGQGELSARVEVQGRDEVAELARSFNDAAARVESLVLAQRRLLASASHELRSPLARLRLALAMLDDGAEDKADLHQEAERDIDELDRLIGDVLLGARLEAGTASPRREPVALGALLREEAARVGAEVSGPEFTVQGDPALLRSLVRNLLENARRHGGGQAEAWLEPEGEMVVLVVADRGPGLPERERERVFEPFYQPPGHRESAGGVGLGLALVRQIAEAHGGSARHQPREGGGSRFEVRVPS